MIDKSITFKGTEKGISIRLNEELSYEEFKARLVQKVDDSEGFFNGARTNLTFEGRELTDSQKQELIDIITERTGMQVLSLSEKSAIQINRQDKRKDLSFNGQVFNDDTLYYKKSVRNGQKITSEGSVIIIGDVNPGGEIEAAGNIIVFGTHKGMAHAGNKGDKNAFIAAVGMNPIQLRIADIIVSFPKEVPREIGNLASIAYIVDGQMMVEAL